MLRSGTLFYLVGASGSGKDSLMRYARTHLDGQQRVLFAHRYITRPPEICGENHVSLTIAEFAERLHHGCFAMHWQSHGYHYSVGIEIDQWLSWGFRVVVNGSRAYLPQAQARYPQLQAVVVKTSSAVLMSRLQARNRETPAEIEARLKRSAQIRWPAQGGLEQELIEIDNDQPLEVAGQHFVDVLTRATNRCA